MTSLGLVLVCLTLANYGFCQLPDFFTFEAPLSQCVRLDPNGNEIITEYDVCTSFCCGGFVVDSSTRLQCCGSVSFGTPYNPRFQQCCEWWTGHGMGHTRLPGQSFQCCGANRISYGPQQCCQGHPDPPEVFQIGRQMCCNAHAVGIPAGVNPMFAECCGEEEVYDRRFDACPCRDGRILRNVTNSRTACCETPEGLQTPYIPEVQICCTGQVGTIEENFCCGELGVGTIGDQVCCSDKFFPVIPRNVNNTACCTNNQPYNPVTELCCDNEVLEVIEGADQCCGDVPYNDVKSICCGEILLSRDTVGTECCGRTAFFPGKGSFCCNGNIFTEQEAQGDTCCGEGESITFFFEALNDFICCNGTLNFRENEDSCCATTGYEASVSVCCDGAIFDRILGDECCQGQAYFNNENTICCDDGPFGPFQAPRCCNGQGYDVEGGMLCCGGNVFGPYRWPACCVDVGYDAFTHTCCNAEILETPFGSNAGECCANVALDRNSQLCCEGENVTIPEGTPRSRAECCNFEVFNNDTQLCCAGTIQERTNQFTTRCCGADVYNTTEFLCCEEEDGSEPTLFDFEFGMDSTACCGPRLYNTTEQFCCDGFVEEQIFDNTECCSGRVYNRDESICCEGRLQSIGNVPPQRAECCGLQCMYRGPQRCCNDRIYELNVRSNNTCTDF